MTLKPRCDCSTCDACGNAPGRSGYCLNCEVTDSGAPGTHAQHTPGPWYTAWAISTEHGPVCNIRTGKQGMGPTVALVYGDEANAPDKPITYEQAQANAALIATAPETAAERDRLRQVNEVMVEALRAAHKHAHKALTAKSNSYMDEANMLDVIAAALAAAEGPGDTQS